MVVHLDDLMVVYLVDSMAAPKVAETVEHSDHM